MLFNIGFIEAMKEYNWTCIIFHDVDLVPEDDRNIYRFFYNILWVFKIIFRCTSNPRHMSVAVDKFEYELPYNLFGGAVALTPHQFR